MAYNYHTYPVSPRRITHRQAYAVLHSNQKAVFLDVRSRQEYNTGHIPGALLLPDSLIETQANRLLHDKSATIIVYCKSGGRSKTASSTLVAMGYTNVYNLGGIDSWPYERE